MSVGAAPVHCQRSLFGFCRFDTAHGCGDWKLNASLATNDG
jgi:hypothetical protein